MAFPFRAGAPTVGTELEWHLVDARTFELRDVVLELFSAGDDDPHVKPEFLQCGVEVTAGPADSVADLRKPLLRRLRALQERCGAHGVRLCGGATHPMRSGPRAVTPDERYFEAAHLGAFVSERLQATCALHVHVGMPSTEACLAVVRRLRGTLPALLALSSSSPFWDGYDTGFASFRHRILAMTPDYGPPPAMTSPADLERVMRAIRCAGIGTTYRDVHWDLRPRPDFGTLELRVFDGQPTVSSSLALAAVAHALMVAALRGRPSLDDVLLPSLPPWIERANAFRASRFGVDAELLVDEDGQTRSARELLGTLLATLAPVAVELGAGAELQDAVDVLLDGTWADRARALYARSGSFARTTQALCDALDDELLAERRGPPGPRPRELG